MRSEERIRVEIFCLTERLKGLEEELLEVTAPAWIAAYDTTRGRREHMCVRSTKPAIAFSEEILDCEWLAEQEAVRLSKKDDSDVTILAMDDSFILKTLPWGEEELSEIVIILRRTRKEAVEWSRQMDMQHIREREMKESR